MQIIYCNVGKMSRYDGIKNDSLTGGGSYNKTKLGHEVNNFTNHSGHFFGFVQAKNDTIWIEKHFDCTSKDDFANNVLVIWCAKNMMVGYYKNARVYRKIQYTPDDVTAQRHYSDYNITATDAVLIPESIRDFEIPRTNKKLNIGGFGQSNVWYGNDETNKKVLAYIDFLEAFVEDIPDNKPLDGAEKKELIKVRVNQNIFRERILDRFGGTCCLCGIGLNDALIASHIKPWSKSNNTEKLSVDNGLLLCPNHDKLFDLGYISFGADGNILISESLSETDRILLNADKNMRLDLQGDMRHFIQYHRENIFKDPVDGE